MNRSWLLIAGLTAGSILASAGCHTDSDKNKTQPRSQVGEDSAGDLDATTTVGQKTSVANTEPIQVSGVGLVYGLPGTGSGATPGVWRTMLENYLKKQNISNLKEVLDDPQKSTSLVLLSAFIPPGARKGDPIDIQITLPEDSKTTSLKGGKLFRCDLYNSDTTGNLQSMARDGRVSAPSGDLKLGDVWAKAEGNVIASLFIPSDGKSNEPEKDADGEPVFKMGKIWGGAVITRNRPYYITMNPGDQNTRMAMRMAERLNSTFHTTSDQKVADAKSKELILVNVPLTYRNNPTRFLRVARQVPILPPKPDGMIRRKLEEDLLDPKTTLVAAIKLEALGASSMKSLRLGLESPSPWVCFASAEALTYLGQSDGAAELARLAQDYPALRAPSLKALASMDDGSCTDRLAELMKNPDPMLRYGAFCSLRLADDNSTALHAELVNKSFWIHEVATGSPGMVHLTSNRRCEIVLFGDNIKFRGPFTLPIGSDFTIAVPANSNEATITRIVRAGGDKADLEPRKEPCPTSLYATLLTIGKLGGGYDEAVELIRRADRAHVLTAPVVMDAIVPELNINKLAEYAAKDPVLEKANLEVIKAGAVRTDLDFENFDLPPQETDPAVTVTTPPASAPLNRNHGHLIFKPHDQPTPEPPVVPAGGN